MPLRSQNLVFTLYGDYLVREPPVWAGALITLLGQLGLSPMGVRVVLSRMTRKGWLVASREGPRSFYGLSRKGRALLEEGSQRIYHPPLGQAWDGDWSIVTYGIPESLRRRRDALRTRLAWLGLGPLGSGLWITPHDVEADVRRIAGELRVERYVEVFRGLHAGLSDPARLVRQCWDLRALNRRYAEFLRRWTADFDSCRQCALTGLGAGIHQPCTSPADCFRRRFLLVHEYRSFPLHDPYLPAMLLPDDWYGADAARLFERYHDALEGAAERYVAEVCREGADDRRRRPDAGLAPAWHRGARRAASGRKKPR